jgi:general secretion pathway protein E
MPPADDTASSFFGRQAGAASTPSNAPSYPPATREEAYARVLDWLREHAGLTPSAEASAARAEMLSQEPVPLALNRLGLVGDYDLQAAFMAVSGLPAAHETPDESVRDLVTAPFLKARRAILLSVADTHVSLGLVDPFDDIAVRGVVFATGKPARVSVLRSGDQRRLFASMFETRSEGWDAAIAEQDDTRLEAALEFSRDAPVARRVAGWLAAAVERRASDVHIEPRAHGLAIRFRVDGQLETIAEEPLAAAASVLARIKVLADLDLGERRAAQDGRTTIVVAGRPVDVRVSVVPSVNGEAAVLRILDRSEVRLSFDTLGFSRPERDILDQAVSWPYGLFLVTGPTGSGKTTTLYAALEAMRHSGRKILTIEDPVEFHFDHVTQVQYAPKAGVTFPTAIRAFLRQDPDVILVGEIRDGDTARAAIQAALTGHLVLATLHAIDVERAAPRLLDMGVEPFQLAACYRGAMAQRLVRRLCPHCRHERQATEAECAYLGAQPGARLFETSGCVACNGTGFLGRIAIAEAFASDPAQTGEQGDDLAVGARLTRGMRDDGVEKILAGQTSVTEVRRALSG